MWGGGEGLHLGRIRAMIARPGGMEGRLRRSGGWQEVKVGAVHCSVPLTALPAVFCNSVGLYK